MKTENYERNNIRRWILLLLNCLFAIGTTFPLIGGNRLSAWFIIRNVREFRLNGLRHYYSLINFCYVFCSVLLVIVPALHILKLIGLMGEKRRNKAALSWLFSALEFVGAAGIPAAYIAWCCLRASGIYDPKEFFRSVSVWSYAMVLLTLFAMILSIRLMPTPPVFKSLAGNNDRDIVCSDCGRRNPSDANFCLGCGKKLVENMSSSKWYCPICGSKNAATVSRCTSCGAYRPKGY